MTDTEIIKAFDILDKFEFFGGQRAGRELWFDKPVDVQNADIENFSSDVRFLKDLINRQQAENERLKRERDVQHDSCNHYMRVCAKAHIEGAKEFAERLKETFDTWHLYGKDFIVRRIDNLLKEMG